MPFAPDELSPNLWFRADQDLYLDGDLNPVVNDGDLVFLWQDQTANLDDVSRTAESERPSYKVNILNGEPAVRFDGTNDLLRHVGSNWGSASAGMLAAVVIPRGGAGTAFRCIFSTCDEGSSLHYFLLRINDADKLEVAQRNNDTADSVIGNTTLTVGTPYIVILSSDGTAWSMRVNGVAQTLTVAAGANTGDWTADTANRDSFALGCLLRSTASNFFFGDILEFASFPADKTLAEKEGLEEGWAAKWNVDIGDQVAASVSPVSISLSASTAGTLIVPEGHVSPVTISASAVTVGTEIETDPPDNAELAMMAWRTPWMGGLPVDISSITQGDQQHFLGSQRSRLWGQNVPTSPQNATTSGAGTAWTNPQNILASDDARASVTLTTGTSSNWLVAFNFGLSIPEQTVINGIEVVFERFGNATFLSQVQLMKAGVQVAEVKQETVAWFSEDSVAFFGDSMESWQTTWTAADVNHSGFGVALKVSQSSDPSATANIDHVTITVYYSHAIAGAVAPVSLGLSPLAVSTRVRPTLAAVVGDLSTVTPSQHISTDLAAVALAGSAVMPTKRVEVTLDPEVLAGSVVELAVSGGTVLSTVTLASATAVASTSLQRNVPILPIGQGLFVRQVSTLINVAAEVHVIDLATVGPIGTTQGGVEGVVLAASTSTPHHHIRPTLDAVNLPLVTPEAVPVYLVFGGLSPVELAASSVAPGVVITTSLESLSVTLASPQTGTAFHMPLEPVEILGAVQTPAAFHAAPLDPVAVTVAAVGFDLQGIVTLTPVEIDLSTVTVGIVTFGQPTMTVTDEGDGTGAELTIANVIGDWTFYVAEFEHAHVGDWEEVESGTGSETLTVALDPGYYWAYAHLISEETLTEPVYFRVTAGTESVFQRCLEAVKSRIETLLLEDVQLSNITILKRPWNRGFPTGTPAVSVWPLVEVADHLAGSNLQDDKHYGVGVSLWAASNQSLTSNIDRHLSWREDITRAFENQPLALVPEIYKCEVEPFNDPYVALEEQYDVQSVIIRCKAYEPRH